MDSLFNKTINRKNTSTYKWDFQDEQHNLPFWIADSDYQTYQGIIDELKKVSEFGVFGYNKVPNEFKSAIINWYFKRYHSVVKDEWIIPSTGVILEIRILLEILTKENDSVILQTPVYHTFHKLINKMNRKIVVNKLINNNNYYEIDFDNLETLFKEGNKVLILCSPHNPVGRIWTKDEIEKVIKLAKKYDAYVIVDEIHSDLNITEHKFTSACDYFNIYDKVMVCNAPSKAFNLAGLCTSYVIIPSSDLRNKFNEVVEREFLNEPTVFGYQATIKAYEEGFEWIKLQNEHLKKNYLFLKEYLNKNLEKIKVTILEGTYLVWLDLSFTKLRTEELLKKCNEFGITCSGGVNFGSDYESFLRFNIACPISQLEEGLNRLVNAFKEY